MRLLVVEDEVDLTKSLARGLREEGFTVDTAADGERGLFMAQTGRYDALIVDWMLPKLDGQQLIKRLRPESAVPALILTARGGVEDRVAGLTVADDYLVKPFVFEELLARVRALLRRPATWQREVIVVGELELNQQTKTAHRRGQTIKLSPREFALLEALMLHPGQVLSRDELLERVWGYDYAGFSNVVDVYIRYLRKKIDRPFPINLIQTIRGFGYTLKVK